MRCTRMYMYTVCTNPFPLQMMRFVSVCFCPWMSALTLTLPRPRASPLSLSPCTMGWVKGSQESQMYIYRAAGIFLGNSIRGVKSGFPKIEGVSDMHQVVRLYSYDDVNFSCVNCYAPSCMDTCSNCTYSLQGLGAGGGIYPLLCSAYINFVTVLDTALYTCI